MEKGSTLSNGTIPISQAERFDVIIDFSKYAVGAEVTLKNLLDALANAERAPSSIAPHTAASRPQPYQHLHRQMHQRAEQPWLWGARFAHPAFGAMQPEWADGWRRPWRAKDRDLEHIGGPMISHWHPQPIAF